MQDISRGTTGVLLPAEVSNEVLAKVQEASIVQTAALRVGLPGAGVSYQTITQDPVANWVEETAPKQVSNGIIGSKTMQPYKLAVIQAFSNEFRRDKNALYQELVRRLPNALAKKFDETVFFGTAPGSNFDTLENVNPLSLNDGVYDAFVDAIEQIGVASYDMNGIILSPQAEAEVLRAKDLQDRPLFIDSVQREGSIGSALGRPVFRSRHAFEAGEPDVVGFVGDWTKIRWGTVEDVSIKVSDQASLQVDESTRIDLFQQNMFAILTEIEVGVLVEDEDAFLKLTKSSES